MPARIADVRDRHIIVLSPAEMGMPRLTVARYGSKRTMVDHERPYGV